MHRPHRNDAKCEVSGFRALRCGAYLLLALGAVTTGWAVFVGAGSSRPIVPIATGLAPLALMLLALRCADTPLLKWVTMVSTAILVFGSVYIYLDAFLVHLSSLNSVLLLQVPLVQTVVALPELVWVLASRRARRVGSSRI